MNRSRLSDSQGRRHLGLRIKMTSVRTSFLADRCLNARDSHQPPSITRHAKPNRNPPANHQPNHRCLEKWQSAPVAKAVGFSPQRGISHKRRLEAVLQRHQSDAAALSAEKHNFRTKWWGTYRQWEQLGGNVMRRPEEVEPGHWGTAVILWRPVEKTEVDPDTGEESTKTFGFLKQYHLFNLDQVEGECLDRLRVTDTVVENEFVDFEPADQAIAATGADIRYGGDRAFYRRPLAGDGDFIQLPHKGRFLRRRSFTPRRCMN